MRAGLPFLIAHVAPLVLATPVPAAPAPTFNKDIAPILWARCGGCHRPGELAPFSVIDYRDVAPRGRQIVAAIRSRAMPPWLPEPGHGEFADARRIPDDEVRRIEEWVKQGAPQGRPEDLPLRPTWTNDWQLGPPDLVVEAPDAIVLQPGGADVFRNVVIPVPLASTRYVRGIEVRPGNRRVVHHASLAIDRTSASRQLDAADPGPGFGGGMFSESARSPESRALGWTPGMTASFEPPDMAWQLHKGSDIVLMLHLMPSGLERAEVVRPSIGFYFTDTPPSRMPIDFKLGSKAIDIPAGAPGYAIEDRYTLPVDVDLLSVYPHAHYLAKEMRATATLPDGTVRDLLWIRNWDFNWQDQYRYATPVPLPRGSVLAMKYTYDNSDANKRNTMRRPIRVVYGPQSSDEMGDLWLRLLPRTVADASTLAMSYRDHQVQNDVALGERMVAAAPADARWRNRLGAAYLEAGRVPDAIVQLAEALRLAPGDPDGHNNLGHALQLQGRFAEAVPHFRDAVRLAPSNDLVHLNLGNALQELGRLDEAIGHFERAIELNPAAADAHNNLGVALGSTGRLNEAVRHFRAALEIQPDYADAMNNLQLALGLQNAPR